MLFSSCQASFYSCGNVKIKNMFQSIAWQRRNEEFFGPENVVFHGKAKPTRTGVSKGLSSDTLAAIPTEIV